MASTANLTVSVIVPVYNGGTAFRECLSSLSHAFPTPEEVIVVADGDTDGSGQLAEKFGFKVLRFPSPGGPGRARNLGGRTARGDLLFFVDADVIIPRDALSQIVPMFENGPTLAALIGSYDDQPGARNFLSQYRNLLHHFVHQSASEEAFTFWGACGVIRRETFVAIGGFVETYQTASIEDIELGYRLRRSGYCIRLNKQLQVKHLKRWDAASMLKADFFCRALPWTDLILREGQMVNDLNLSISSRISVIAVYSLFLAVLATAWQPAALVFVGAFGLLLLGVNASLYRSFFKKRGLLFTLGVIPWHWFYYGYSGLAFGIGFIRHFYQQAARSRCLINQ